MVTQQGPATQFGRLKNYRKWDELTALLNASGCECIKTIEKWKKFGFSGKQRKKSSKYEARNIIYWWWSIQRMIIIRARAAALGHNGKSAITGGGPEIGLQNVTLAVPVEQVAVGTPRAVVAALSVSRSMIRIRSSHDPQFQMLRRHEGATSSGGQHLAAFQAFEDYTDSKH
ncbi:hypothetical protein EVAR_32002_1 [Eumeta japonica]|uniref:Uncharacterized protein n=1 Tax=Eumeta variegata TaxID=151549 RepID=A0A4C2ACG6_EUMVA|nr:hypothetical protein EVAR_32002_1 [Eumeta japonica]